MNNHAELSSPPRLSARPFADIGTKRGRYSGHGEDYIMRFYRLLRRWRAETAYVSSTTDMLDHPAFIEIVGMGQKVVPLIIDELRRQPDHLIGALIRITGENPVPAKDLGDVYAMASAWIDWYEHSQIR